MRRVIAAVGVAAGVALGVALAAAGAVGAQASTGQVRAREQKPVAVRLLAPSAFTREPLRYFLSEPAYVAAFVIYPGRGVRLIYPEVGEERQQAAGYHADPLWQANWDAAFEQVILGPPSWGPHYLYIIASRAPLGIARYVHHPLRLANAVGLDTYRSFDSDEQFIALVNRVLSVGNDDAWDADTYMLWTNPPDLALGASAYSLYYPTRVVYCRGGASMIVPFNYPFTLCPGDARLVPNLPATPPAPQSASAEARSVPAPTVLPTIRGMRKPVAVDDERPLPATAGFRTTAAGGATVVRGDGAPTVPAPTVTVIREQPIIVAPGSVYDREELHRGGRAAERGDRVEGPVSLPPRTGPVTVEPPHLAPAPQLPPAPRLTPAPEPVSHPAPQPPPQPPPARQVERPIMREPVVRVEAPPRPVSAPPAQSSEPRKQQ